MRKFLLLAFFTSLIIGNPCFAAQSTNSILLLQSAISDLEKSVDKTNDEILNALKALHSSNIRQTDMAVAAQGVQETKSQVQTLANKKKEHLLRLNFLRTLQTNLQGRPLTAEQASETMANALLSMSFKDLSGSIETNSSADLWEFESNLAIVSKEREPFEDPIAFTLEYMNYSSILTPRLPTDFLIEARNYRGAPAQEAKPAPPQDPDVPAAPAQNPNPGSSNASTAGDKQTKDQTRSAAENAASPKEIPVPAPPKPAEKK